LIKESNPKSDRKVHFSMDDTHDTEKWFTGEFDRFARDIFDIDASSDNEYGFEDYEAGESIWDTNPDYAIAKYLNSFEDEMLLKRRVFKYSGPKITQEEKLMRDELHCNMKKLCKDLMIIEQMQTKFYGKEHRSTKKAVMNSIAKVSKNRSATDLDLMFIMDCTSSMSSYISQCKRDINEIVRTIKEENNGVKVRISFVGYRDFDQGDRSMSVLGFTKEVEVFEKFMLGVRAAGGGDAAEDMAGGFEQVLKQSWGNNSTKVGIIICDAPCHTFLCNARITRNFISHP